MHQTIFRYFLATTAGLAAFIASKNRIIGFLKEKKIIAVNYAGKDVINGGGLLLTVSTLVSYLLLMLFDDDTAIQMYFLIALALSFAGLLDDTLGDPSDKGLSGHVRCLIKGSFSTGILKAMTGLALGIVLSLSIYSNAMIFLIDTVLFALCVNVVNLLDLRPGRAIKGWLLILLLFMILGRFSLAWILFPLFAGICLYMKDEMQEVYMLGDTGSCLLGGTAGFYAVLALPITAKVFFMVLLSVLHVLAEHISLSIYIEKVPMLKKLDRLGRKE